MTIEIKYYNKIKEDKDKPYKLKVRTSEGEFSQNFDTKERLIIEDFSGAEMHGEYIEIPLEEVEVIIPLRDGKYNPVTKNLDFPKKKNVKLDVKIEKNSGKDLNKRNKEKL